MRNIWLGMRHALLTLVVIVVGIVVAMWQLAGAERRWLVTVNGLLLVPRFDTAHFFQDSVFVVDLEPNDARRYPIRIAGYHAGSRVPIGEREIGRVIREVAGERRGARITATPARRSMPLPAPSVTIAYDFWDGGGVRADIVVTCRSLTSVSAGSRVQSNVVSSSRSRYTRSADLKEGVTRDLAQAAETRCPEDRLRYVSRPDGGMALVDPRELSLTPVRDVASAPTAQANQSLLASAARRDSSMAAAMARARAAFYAVAEIRVSPDTVRLVVGENVRPEQALRLTALRRDGSIVERFAPLYVVQDLGVARMSAAGFRGLKPGTTVVTIRPFMPTPNGTPEGGARAQVVLKVTP